MVSKLSLPVVDCEGCGACCLEMGSPPGFVLFYPPPGKTVYLGTLESEDGLLWQALPQPLKDELAAYYAQMRAGGEDRDGEPCLWFDEATRQCRHYEHRPRVCRDFKVGCDGCLAWRSQYGIDPERGAR